MAANSWDQNQIFTAQSLATSRPQDGPNELNRKGIEELFYGFIQTFSLDNNYVYRDQLVSNIKSKYYGLDVQFSDVIAHNATLAQSLTDEPTEYIEAFEAAVTKAANNILRNGDEDMEDEEGLVLSTRTPKFQVILKSSSAVDRIRNLTSESVGKLVKITGIVVAASTLSSKASQLQIRCKSCGFTKKVPVYSGLTGVHLPRYCDNPNKENNADKCPEDPFEVDHDRSRFVDQQTLKIQESPDMVPNGELPKHLLLSADRCLVNRVVPGSRAVIIGVFSVFTSSNSRNSSGVATRTPYVRMVGLVSDTEGLNRGVTNFSDEEVIRMEQLARDPEIYNRISRSIASSIYGNENMKKAIACLLFSGSTKRLPDGVRLRGDINVLMLGDPSTAKSQLLKFAERVAPISVYTSGKGSSAAGLTASVVRDPGSREFYLEGGAMVLADGGIVCIDEFDKMRDEDRVAIHEAMEQQTISIAKAGITTMLNSRTSILAAANPIYGHYDDLRTPGENIDFQTTILSRFDLIFIVRDTHDPERDSRLARHVMNIHMNSSNDAQASEMKEGDLDVDQLKRYIAFAKTRCAPRLSPEAAEALSGHFVSLRREVHRLELEAEQRSAIPITIRQLEAIVRITESLAKMQLSPVATIAHVDEAIRLFKSSTMDAIQRDEGGSGSIFGTRTEMMRQMSAIDREVRTRLPVGSQVTYNSLRDILTSESFHSSAIDRSIQILVRQEVLQYRNNRKSLYRCGM